MPITNDNKIHVFLQECTDIQPLDADNLETVNSLVLFESELLPGLPGRAEYLLTLREFKEKRSLWHRIIDHLHEKMRPRGACWRPSYFFLFTEEAWYVARYRENGFLMEKSIDWPLGLCQDTLLMRWEGANHWGPIHWQEQLVRLTKYARLTVEIEKRVREARGNPKFSLNRPLGHGDFILEIAQAFITMDKRCEQLEYDFCYK